MSTRLKRLRMQLTVFYFFAALSMVLLLGGGSYLLLQGYLYNATDQAIQVKMALLMRQYGLELPPELAEAEQNWLGAKGLTALTATQAAILTPTQTPTPSTTPTPTLTAFQTPTQETGQLGTEIPATDIDFSDDEIDDEDIKETKEPKETDERDEADEPDETEEPQDSVNKSSYKVDAFERRVVSTSQPEKEEEAEEENEESPQHDYQEGRYDEELAPVFVIPLDQNSDLIMAANLPSAPISQDRAAAAAALANGSDLRTIQVGGANRARLLTYRVDAPGGPALLQVGRLLGDQDRVLRQYLIGWLILTGLSAVLIALGSWWLSGRTLGPAQQAWGQQQAFIANASHELRTPLTLIRASAEVGLRAQANDDKDPYLRDILGETDYMNKLVDDLLLLSRLDASRLDLKREGIDLDALFAQVESQFARLANAKNVTLKVQAGGGRIWGDPLRMRQVLLILLDNALRFSPAGGNILLSSRSNGKQRQVMVRDQGEGIPAADLPLLFDRFYQVKGSSVDHSHNNGLGLSIAKGLVEAQAGSIQIRSKIGAGTEVVLTFLDS